VSVTRVATVSPTPHDDDAVREAAALIRAGDVVAFPTETVYGLGASALSEEAVARIYLAKQRPADNPSIVHVLDGDHVGAVAREWSDTAELLARTFWPGPLTLVVPATDAVARAVGRGLGTVGLRAPAHPVARALLLHADGPIAAPSANLSGRPSPTTAEHVLADLGGRIPLILDGGPCRVGLESTVLDLTSAEPTILRPGAVTRDEIAAALDRVVGEHGTEAARRRSPGTRYRHYRPSAPVALVRTGYDTDALARWVANVGERIGYVGWREEIATLPSVTALRVAYSEPERLASMLYAALRDLDARGVRYIVVDEPDQAGVGAAVSERLARAATLVFVVGSAEPSPVEIEEEPR